MFTVLAALSQGHVAPNISATCQRPLVWPSLFSEGAFKNYECLDDLPSVTINACQPYHALFFSSDATKIVSTALLVDYAANTPNDSVNTMPIVLNQIPHPYFLPNQTILAVKINGQGEVVDVYPKGMIHPTFVHQYHLYTSSTGGDLLPVLCAYQPHTLAHLRRYILNTYDNNDRFVRSMRVNIRMRFNTQHQSVITLTSSSSRVDDFQSTDFYLHYVLPLKRRVYDVLSGNDTSVQRKLKRELTLIASDNYGRGAMFPQTDTFQSWFALFNNLLGSSLENITYDVYRKYVRLSSIISLELKI